MGWLTASSVIAKWPICVLHTSVKVLYPRVFCNKSPTSSRPTPKQLREQLQKRRFCGSLSCFLCLKGYCFVLILDFLIIILKEFSHDSFCCFILFYFIFTFFFVKRVFLCISTGRRNQSNFSSFCCFPKWWKLACPFSDLLLWFPPSVLPGPPFPFVLSLVPPLTEFYSKFSPSSWGSLFWKKV